MSVFEITNIYSLNGKNLTLCMSPNHHEHTYHVGSVWCPALKGPKLPSSRTPLWFLSTVSLLLTDPWNISMDQRPIRCLQTPVQNFSFRQEGARNPGWKGQKGTRKKKTRTRERLCWFCWSTNKNPGIEEVSASRARKRTPKSLGVGRCLGITYRRGGKQVSSHEPIMVET